MIMRRIEMEINFKMNTKRIIGMGISLIGLFLMGYTAGVMDKILIKLLRQAVFLPYRSQ